ncbi:OsmC family protein [bacterium]|nr:OsmC family protein [bacterium]
MQRFASAQWQGALKDGKGTMTTGSGVLTDIAYDFGKRFADEPGTNPEELIAAAHSGCFSMALANILDGDGFPPQSVETKATMDFEKTDAGFTITKIHLDTVVKAEGLTEAALQDCAGKAKAGCPVSRALTAEITFTAKLG